jgi:hypothetical protein
MKGKKTDTMTEWMFSEVVPYCLMLTIVTMGKFTTHKYINLQEYEPLIDHFVEGLEFPEEKVWKILVSANLAFLLIDLIEMTAAWEKNSPEGRTLMIDDVVLRFPKQFLTPREYRGASEDTVLVELRTQGFVQTYLESLSTDLVDWTTTAMIDDIMHVTEKSPPDEEEVHKVHPTGIYLMAGFFELPPTGPAKSFAGIHAIFPTDCS